MTEYAHLFSPMAIGRVELKNRLAMLPMATRMPTDGTVNAQDLRYHEERAKGGVGLIIAGGMVVHPTSQVRGRMLLEPWNEAGFASLQERVRTIQQHGCRVFGQFLHLGRESPGAQSDEVPLAPSPIPSPRDPFIPHQMTTDEIRMVVSAFGDTAGVLEASGHDGLEIHAAHGYMIAQFLSPASNRRDDAYGIGSWDTRMRLLLEILEAVRERVAPDMPVGVRLSADEETADGMHLDDTLEIVTRLQATGLIDYLSITRGMRNAYIKDGAWPEAVALDLAEKVKAITDVPVLVGGRFRDPETAEQALAEGRADLIGLGRALIADPAWVEKAQTGRATIRPCVAFVQDCRLAVGGLTCAVNPAAGREIEWGGTEVAPSAQRRSVVVVGGGPAGLEAARLAAERGHRVRLVEGDDALGGQLRWAAAGPTRADLADFVTYSERELARLGVDVELGLTVTADQIVDMAADVVVVATGSAQEPCAVPVAHGASVMTTDALLAGGAPEPAGQALVVDDGTGFWPAISAAELLVAAGWQVSLATPARAVGLAVPHESIGGVHARLGAGRVQLLPFSRLTAIEPAHAVLADVLTGDEHHVRAVVVVVQTPRTARSRLLDELRGRVTEVFGAGDCLAPRRLTHAVLDANRIVRSLA